VYLTNQSSVENLFALIGDANNLGVMLGISTGGVVTLQKYSNAATVITGPTLSTGQWYVCEFSYKGSTGACELMVDGTSYGTGTADVARVLDPSGREKQVKFQFQAASPSRLA
jgi:hypothetical protein